MKNIIEILTKDIVFTLKPLMFSFLMVALWYFGIAPFVQLFGSHIEDGEIMGYIAAGFVAFSLTVPGGIFIGVLNEFQETETAIRNNDFKQFKSLLYKRVPSFVYKIMAQGSLVVMFFVMIVAYKSNFIGGVAVFGYSFFQYMIIMATVELDDPIEGRYNISAKLPKKWQEEYEKAKKSSPHMNRGRFIKFIF